MKDRLSASYVFLKIILDVSSHRYVQRALNGVIAEIVCQDEPPDKSMPRQSKEGSSCLTTNNYLQYVAVGSSV